MALSLVTAITNEPVTLDEMRGHLRLDIEDDDGYIAGCISDAREWVEGQTRRSLMPATYDYFVDYHWPWKYGGYRIDLPLSPVTSVTSVKYVDLDGAEQTLGSSQYIVASRDFHSFIVPAYDVDWPDVRCVPNAVTVRFVAGNADEIPQPLRRAIMVLAGHLYEDREGGPVPEAVHSMVAPYRRSTF